MLHRRDAEGANPLPFLMLFLDALESNPLISLERLSMVMLVADNLPRNAFWKGIAGSLFLCVTPQVLTFCALWYKSLSVWFHWLLPLSGSKAAGFEFFSFYTHTTQQAVGKYR